MIVLHIPHALKNIPTELRDSFLLSDADLATELIRMTDGHTDELFSINSGYVRTVGFPLSRLVLDPERFLDDSLEPMAERGMGVVYTKTSYSAPLRRDPSEEERRMLVSSYYRSHQEAVEHAVNTALEQRGACLIIDCHSFPSKPLPCEVDQTADRPDVCIGTDEYHTPKWLSDLAMRLFSEEGYRVKLNRPYSGAFIPSSHYRSDTRVWAIMIELNRSLYMDEATGMPHKGFEITRSKVQNVIRSIINHICVVPLYALNSLRARSLFYPSSGSDFLTPIKVFAPWINDFWFVDSHGHSDRVLNNQTDYRLSRVTREIRRGITLRSKTEFEIKITNEIYHYIDGSHSIQVHWCCGRGYDAFRVIFKLPQKPLSVFFYRGDSPGEGGSGFDWLGKGRLRNVLEVLEEGGLIVTDGSNCTIDQLKEFHCNSGIGEEAIREAKQFSFAGRVFLCIGYAGERRGPTLIWQVGRTLKSNR
jgi:N-formylglutamate amidohydrolase